MKSNFALAYRSQSLQGPHKEDFQNPRAILQSIQSKNKEIYISFNGNPDQKRHNNLEILEIDFNQLNNNGNLFSYFDIEFPGDIESKNMSWVTAQQNITFSDANPRACQACHGLPAKPIFQTYPFWKGFYGSKHLTVNKKEEKELSKLVRVANNTPQSRYRHLIFDEFQLLNGTRSNILNQALSNANFLRIYEVVKSEEFYQQMKYAIFGSSLSCKNMKSFYPLEIRKRLEDRIESEFEISKKITKSKELEIIKTFYYTGLNQFNSSDIIDLMEDGVLYTDNYFNRIYSTGNKVTLEKFVSKIDSFFGDWQFMKKLYLDTIEKQGPHRADDAVAYLRFIFEGFNLDMSNWPTELKAGSYRFSDGNEWMRGLAFAMIRQDVDLTTTIGYQSDAVLKSIFRDNDPIEYHDPTKAYQDRLDREEKLCRELANLSINSLSSFNINNIEIKKKSISKSALEILKTNCTECHVTSNVGPRIPFNNSEDFYEWVKINKTKILYRLTTNNTFEKMPLNRHLKTEDLENIINYIKMIGE
ncbi:MAG: hypothetical protein H6625_06985 [Bdellovibrionaceae bacterium]|nr:hypothetical protein [Pseudobdellovibrionaceae bacterium]